MRRILNIGVTANDGTGDKLRHAFDLSQQNFVELYTFFGDGENITSLSVRQKLDTPTNAEVNQKISTAINPAFVHIESTSNPHGVTKAQVGLPDVDNTSDANKPISTKAQTALDLKADKTSRGAVSGVASLDSNKKVPVLELPTASTAQQGIVQLVNDLTSTDSGKALSAAMGKALSAMSIGAGGTYRDMKSQRALNVNYTNTAGGPILVSVRKAGAEGAISIIVDTVMVDANNALWSGVTAIVPNGSRYVVSHTGTVETWVEL